MDASLPPFGIRQLRDGEPFSILQIDEKQYQSIIEPNPQATLSYIDEDDGEDVTVGSSVELRQRLEENPTSSAPFIRCYDTAKAEKEDRYIHLFDIQRTNSSQSIWKEHALAYKRARKCYEKAQKAHKDNCDNGSISSIDLNSDDQSHPDASSLSRRVQPSRKSDMQSKPQPNSNVVLADAIPTLVENLANLLQTTSETLRKAAEKSRESQTSPIEDVLSGVSNIVTEIGSFGLSLLDNLNDNIGETSDQSASISDISQTTNTAESPVEVVVESSIDQISHVKDDSTDSFYNTPTDSSANVSVNEEARCKLCSLAQLPCRTWSEKGSACGSCMALGQPCTLTPSDSQLSSETSTASKHSRSISSNSNDGSILDQDTDDADFSRRYPPLMSLRRANTIAGLHNHFVGPSGTDSDSKGLYRHNSWVNRYPHRPIPQVFDVETNRRRNFARDCFPTQKYTPGSVQTGPSDTIMPVASNAKATVDTNAKPSVTIDASPVLTEQKSITIEPLAESSGAFFHRMMRDNPSRRQNHAPETSERLARHRSYSRQRPNNNPFSSLNRSNTVSNATNPASRLNRPFDPLYPVVAPMETETPKVEVKTMQNVTDTSIYGTSEPRVKMAQRPHSLHRPFSPVWEEHLNQIKVHKDQISKLDRNGESSSMYSPPPRHMRSVPNFAASVPAPSTSHAVSTVKTSPFLSTSRPAQPIVGGPSAYRNSLPASPSDDVRPVVSHRVPYQHSIPSYSRPDLNPFNVAAIYAPLPRPKNVQNNKTKTKEETASDGPINDCLSALRDMGYGLGDRNLWSRLHVYAGAAGGNVMEAVDMIEQDKRANFGAAEPQDD